MKNTTSQKIEEAISNAEKFIQQMESMDDRKLSKHIDLFRQQIEKAYREKKYSAFELLSEYER
ncbi:MAG: hypothetical protein IT242_06500 [Bacteroidia bacterium]|nr:hypothetical protein [Bacteroidia bacterium]